MTRDRRNFQTGESYRATVEHVASTYDEGEEDYDYRAWVDRKARPKWTSGNQTPSGSEFFVTDGSQLFQKRHFGSETDATVGKTATIHFPAVDLDVDTLNDSGNAVPFDSLLEDFYENDNHYGKFIDVNDGDIDQDGIDDYLDFNGIAGRSFVPLTFQLSQNVINAATSSSGLIVTMRFIYDDASLNGQDGLMRIWMKDADEVRSVGDFLASGQTIDVSEGVGEEITFYVEGVEESNRISLFDSIKVVTDIVGDVWSGTLTDTVHVRTEHFCGGHSGTDPLGALVWQDDTSGLTGEQTREQYRRDIAARFAEAGGVTYEEIEAVIAANANLSESSTLAQLQGAADSLAKRQVLMTQVFQFYAALNKINPDTQIWAGQAAIAGTTIKDNFCIAKQIVEDSDPSGGLAGVAYFRGLNGALALSEGNLEIFWDVGWVLLAYEAEGIGRITSLHSQNVISNELFEGILDIHNGRIVDGNKKIFRYEQITILQPVFDQYPTAAAAATNGFPLLVPPVAAPGDIYLRPLPTFRDYITAEHPGVTPNYTDANQRWSFLENVFYTEYFASLNDADKRAIINGLIDDVFFGRK